MKNEKSVELTTMAIIMIKAIICESDGKRRKDAIIRTIIRKSDSLSNIAEVKYCNHKFKFLVRDYNTHRLIDFDPRI
jgi:hypothetical protein